MRLNKIILAAFFAASFVFIAQISAEQIDVEQIEDQRIKIVSLETEGNITVSKTNVLSVVQTRQGQFFDYAAVAADCEAIAKIDGIEYAYFTAKQAEGGIALTFVIVERQLIREVAIFGNNRLRDGFLRSKFDLRRGDYMDNLEIARAIDEIKKAYADRGYYFAQVEIDKEALQEGRVIFRVQEAPRVRVRRINFEGNELFTDWQLRRTIKLSTRRFLFFNVYMSEKAIDEDIERIIDLYRERGYIDAKCTSHVEFSERLNSAVITFKIEEGQQFYLGTKTYTGNEYFSDEQLEEKTRLKEGNVFNYRLAEYDRESILNSYLESGFVDAAVVKNRRYREDTDIDLEYAVREGEKFKIDRIEITGNQTTHDKVIRRELDEAGFVPGSLYNASLARGDGQGRLERDIERAALAESVFITPVDSEDGTKTAVVNITEGRTGMVMFGAGIDSSHGIIGQVIFEQRNFDITNWPQSFGEFIRGQSFKGAGQRLRISLEPGTDVTRYSVDFTDPYAWDKPMELNVGSSKYMRGRESFDEDRLRGYVGVTRRYADGWSLGMRVRAEKVKIDADDRAPQEVWDVDGNNHLYGFRLMARKDNTDSRFMPTEGNSYEVNYEQVTGDYNFGIATGVYRHYFTLTEDLARRRTVLSTKLQGSSIVGTAPMFEKFYGGGTGNIRGFDYRGVSPRGESLTIPGRFKDPVGSDWIALANAEVSIPLASDTFNWLLFCDSGMIEDKKLRSSIGTGLEILIPQWFGPVPMRFEFATPLTKEDEDETRVFSFSMGRLF